MSKPVITVENLSKSFTLQHQQPEGGYLALRDVLTDKVRSLFKPGKNSGSTTELFWALKDVSFEVNQGDRIGIIGRNGAGKSTLLKILSRIVAPTKGKITIEGRVASLLEVGTGFHPELTGRENIFLNGAILGMNKAEIKSKFDEIVDFSGVEKFLDTPVKRFSSGMYVRLAFAVAAHLEPEILIIDEVLAVGDAEFQKKCLGKMEDVSKSGRTILFVSHNMGAIQNLCNSAILLANGSVHIIDATANVVSEYLSLNSSYKSIPINIRTDRQGNGALKFTEISLIDEITGNVVSEIQSGSDIIFRLFFERNQADLRNVALGIGINDSYDQRISFMSNEMINQNIDLENSQNDYFDVLMNKFPFAPGRYSFTIYCSIGGIVADWVKNAFYFNVSSGDFYGTGKELPDGQGNFLTSYQIR